jgi:hypothetical protein
MRHRPQRSGFDILRRRASSVRAGADTDDVVGDIFDAFRCGVLRENGARCAIPSIVRK